MPRRIYLASSWRNPAQPAAVQALREAGHEVYDFRNPPGREGFGWSQIDSEWRSWTSEQYRAALQTQRARAGFMADYRGMCWADTFVLLLPCGRSAHLEAGWAADRGREVFVVHPDGEEPELMALLASSIVGSVEQLIALIDRVDSEEPQVYEQLDPGIRGVVTWLHCEHFNTIDSGDGVSKFQPGREAEAACAQCFPNVTMATSLGNRSWEMIRLHRLLDELGVNAELIVLSSPGPKDTHPIIHVAGEVDGAVHFALINVDDKRLFGIGPGDAS